MSLTSKIVLAMSCGVSLGVIYYVHLKQKEDIDKMHEGVIRDRERQHKRKIDNVYTLQQQAELTKLLKIQNRDEEVVLKLLESAKEKGGMDSSGTDSKKKLEI